MTDVLETTANSSRLFQQIADQIAIEIKSGKFPVGSRLPAERDLAVKFEVSRPTVREALIALEIAGMIEVRTGSGAYVCPRPRISEKRIKTQIADSGPSAFELVAARRMIEPPVAGQAALSATSEDLKLISRALLQFEHNWNGTHWQKLEADRQFHMSVAEATHNGLVIGIVRTLWDGMFSPIFAVLSARTKLTDRQSMTMSDHRTILSCIERGDSGGAQAAMMNHLVHVELTLLQNQTPKGIRAGSKKKGVKIL